MHLEKGQLVVPEGTATRAVRAETFKKYREELGGVTQENVPAVTARLVELGLSEPVRGAGTGPSLGVPQGGAAPEPMDVEGEA